MDSLAYFDNAATTFPKPVEVYDFADRFYRNSGGSIGRGGNVLAINAGIIAKQAKENLLTLYGCPDKQVVFTSSATDALNRILLGLDIQDNDVVCITPFEHNAVTRILRHLEDTRQVRIKVLPFDKVTLLPNMAQIESIFIEDKPKLVVLNHASNVCGAVVPVRQICELAKTHTEATTVIDMSQTAGLLDIELSQSFADYAVFAGHKTLYAPLGIGGFICRSDAALKPVFFGGNGIDSTQQEMPSDLISMEEIGSQNTYAIAGLKAATDWILELSIDEVSRRELGNADKLISLLDSYDDIHIVASEMKCEHIGVVSCLFDGYSPDEAEMLLGKFGIAVRSGIQCAPYAHEFLGTLPAGTVRFSVSALTNDSDFAQLQNALEEMCEF